MISQQQIKQNREKIRLKLAKERDDKEAKANKKIETEKIGKEKDEKRTEQASDRSDLAVMISEKIKGVISSELKEVISGIEKLKIDTPEIPEIEIPEIVLPKIEIPEIIIPEIKLPTIVIPKIETPVIPDIVIPEIVLPEAPEIDTDKIIDAVIDGIQETFKNPLKVISIDENGDINKGRIIPGGGAYKWLKNKAGENINPATEDKQDDIKAVIPVPEHKTYFLYGTTSGQTDDLTPTAGKRIRVYGFYGAYTVNAAYNPSADGSLSFGTGGLTDRTKILGASGKVAGARTMIFTMTPMNRVGAVNEIIRFTMATFDAGTAIGNFVILYNEE